MKIKSLIHSKNENALAFFNILGPIILNGINFFTVPIFTRMLGTENYGIVSIYTTWVQVLSIVMGIQTGGTIAVSKAYFEEEEQNAYFSSTLFLSCITSAVITLLTVIFIQPISAFMKLDRVIVLLMLFQSFGSYAISFATLKFIYAKEASKNFLVSVLVSIFSVIISLILIVNIGKFSDRYWGRIIGYALPNIMIGTVLAVMILVKGKTFYHKAYWKFCLPLCLPLIFHHLSQIILAQCDRIMLQQLLNDNGTVGIYSFIFTFVHILNIIWSALNNTWVPFYYDYVKQNNTEVIERKSKNYMFLYTALCIGFVLLSPEVVKLFSSEDFWSGMELIPIIAFSCYMVFLYSFPVNFEFYHKKTLLIACGTCSAAVVNIILNLLFIPWWGNIGAAAATAISYIMLFLFHQIIAKYVIKKGYHYSFSMFLPGICAMILVSVLFYVTIDLWYIRWPIGMILGVILFWRVYRNKSIF
ncbi:MAG: oligosaccharide flippase family protein [Clostridiales bacterium]|nr:oligosaccharide flippase family protein [Clostridiales bacterium]